MFAGRQKKKKLITNLQQRSVLFDVHSISEPRIKAPVTKSENRYLGEYIKNVRRV